MVLCRQSNKVPKSDGRCEKHVVDHVVDTTVLHLTGPKLLRQMSSEESALLGKRKVQDEEDAGDVSSEAGGDSEVSSIQDKSSEAGAKAALSPPSNKVPRVHSPTTAAPRALDAAAAEGDGEGDRSGTPASSIAEDDEGKLREVLEKLKKLVGDDAKMPKALPVLMKAMDASLKPENAAQFLEVVQAAVTSKRMVSQKTRQAFLELFLVMERVKERFGADHQFEVDTVFLKRTHALLFTDDSFVLAKAAGVFQKVITSLPLMKESKAVLSNPRLGLERKQAVLDALETLMLLANLQWAKPTVDVTMKLASDNRLHFPEEQREQLDDMTNKLRAIRNKSALGGGEKKRAAGFPSYSL